MDIKDFTDDEIERELLRRKEEKNTIPKPISNPNFSTLYLLCETINKNIAQNGFADDDNDHYVTYEVFKVIYGENYWEWHKSVLK